MASPLSLPLPPLARPPRSSSRNPRARPLPSSTRLHYRSESMSSSLSSASHSSGSSITKVPALPDSFRLQFVPHPSGGLALVEPTGAGALEDGYVIRPGAEAEGWSRVLFKVGGREAGADGVAFVGSVGEKNLWLRGREAKFKNLYKAKFYSSKVTFTGSDGNAYRWELGSSWKGDNLHLVDVATSRTVLQLLRPNRGPHRLVLTPQSAPMQEFLILAGLQRIWALGLAGPEASYDAMAKEEAKADAEEYSVW